MGSHSDVIIWWIAWTGCGGKAGCRGKRPFSLAAAWHYQTKESARENHTMERREAACLHQGAPLELQRIGVLPKPPNPIIFGESRQADSRRVFHSLERAEWNHVSSTTSLSDKWPRCSASRAKW